MKSSVEYKNEGNQAFLAKDYTKAIELYSKAIEMEPNNSSYLTNRATAYMNISEFQNALNDAESSLKLDPSNIKGYLRAGLSLQKLGRNEEALKVYDDGLQLDPNNKELLNGKQQIEESSKNEGFDMNGLLNNPMVQEMIKKNPQMAQQLFSNPELFKNPQMMQMMMNLLSQQKGQKPGHQQHQHGENCQHGHEEETQFKPSFEQEHKKEEHQFPQQKQHFQESSHSQKKNSEFEQQKNKADELYRQKKIDEAIEQYQKCQNIDNFNLIVRNNQAACFIEKNDFVKAHEILEQAIKIYQETPFEQRSFENYAKVLERQGRIYQLEKNLDKAIEWYEKSLLENQVGRVSGILRELKREKKKQEEEAYLNPELSEQHRQKGNDFYQEGKFAEAIQEYEEAFKRNPKDSKIFNNLAASFMKLMRYDEAKKYIEKALEIDPKNVKALLRKGSIFNFSKEYHKAIDVYKLILEIEPENQEAQKGLEQTQFKISTSMQGESDDERVKRAMTDPEIQSILIDPMVRIALEQMKANPQKAMELLQDQTLAPKIQKLIQAGILRVG